MPALASGQVGEAGRTSVRPLISEKGAGRHPFLLCRLHSVSLGLTLGA
jgi:hypothetical protein